MTAPDESAGTAAEAGAAKAGMESEAAKGRKGAIGWWDRSDEADHGCRQKQL